MTDTALMMETKPADRSAIARLVVYFQAVVRYRDFWMSLVQIDLRNRFRRTKLGVLWIVLQPLLFTMLLSFVLRYLFNQDFVVLSLYIFPGLVLWNWFLESVLLGANAVIGAESFIRQKKLPLFIYPLRAFLVSAASFGAASIGILIWMTAFGPPFGLAALSLPLNVAVIGLALLPLCVISSVLGALYRDYIPAVTMAMQALWFVSPVFIDKAVFMNPGLSTWDRFNPVSNMLELIRMPLLENQLAPAESYLMVLGFALVVSLVALPIFATQEKTIIYRL